MANAKDIKKVIATPSPPTLLERTLPLTLNNFSIFLGQDFLESLQL